MPDVQIEPCRAYICTWVKPPWFGSTKPPVFGGDLREIQVGRGHPSNLSK